METKEITCFCCPRRCLLEAKMTDGTGEWIIRGNFCETGPHFALQKLTAADDPEKQNG